MNTLRPDARLITQNLLVSAAYALESSNPDWASIYDLVVLIDLYCMYDSAVALGLGLTGSREENSLSSALQRSGFLRFESGKRGDLTERITKAARKHVLTYLRNLDVSDELNEVLRKCLSYHTEHHAVDNIPDRVNELYWGSRLLESAASTGRLRDLLSIDRFESEAATFLIRTFLYLGYQDVSELVFVPDAVRCTIVKDIVSNEDEVRGKLLAALDQDSKVGSLPQATKRISPLAAVVFHRSADRQRIVPELIGLREELTPLRRRLQQAEQKIFYGRGKEVAESKNEWKLVVLELRRTYGREPSLVTPAELLRFGKDLAEATDEPQKAKNWIGFLLGLPFDKMSRLLARRPAVELHYLLKERIGSLLLQKKITRLFGSAIAGEKYLASMAVRR